MRFGAAAAMCLALGVVPAHADDEVSAAIDPDPSALRPLWEIGVGVGALRLPDYRGSDQSSTLWLPVPYVVYRGQWLRADRSGARAVLLDARALEVDVSLAASPPTRSKDNAARAGMPDLDATVEIGPNANLTLFRSDDRKLKLDLRLPLRAAFTVQRSPRAAGVNFAPNLNLDLRAGSGWRVGMLSGPVFGDRRYHERVYGVDPAFATPQRPSYRAGGGYSGWQALASVSRRADGMWFGAFLRLDNLHGAAFVDSPLVRRRSAATLASACRGCSASRPNSSPLRNEFRVDDAARAGAGGGSRSRPYPRSAPDNRRIMLNSQ